MDVKLEIRRQVCELLGEPARVLDCCAGRGNIWRRLRGELAVSVYVPVDVAPQIPGTLRMDNREVLVSLNLDQFNVIDVDTYGEPWEQWLTICHRIRSRTAVFLTHGFSLAQASQTTSLVARRCMGIPREWRVPQSNKFVELAAAYCLGRGAEVAKVIEGRRWRCRRAVYYGFLMEAKPATGRGRKRKRSARRSAGGSGPGQ